VSAETSIVPATSAVSSHAPEFGRTAVAILAAMVFLIVALTGILVETTWRNPTQAVEVLPSDPGSFAHR
jgi:hypothetical protein